MYSALAADIRPFAAGQNSFLQGARGYADVLSDAEHFKGMPNQVDPKWPLLKGGDCRLITSVVEARMFWSKR